MGELHREMVSTIHRMICSKCGEEKSSEEFTKVNVSKDGKRGLCKECKRSRDNKHYKKRTASREPKQREKSKLVLTSDLLTPKKVRVGVLMLRPFVDRLHKGVHPSRQYVNAGLRAILNELKEPYEYCDIRYINDYDFVLISLTSVMDIENLIYTFERYAPEAIKSKIIVGGFGVCNIKLIVSYIDVAVFGRAEGQINEIIAGQEFNNVWRKATDPLVEGKYQIRQAQYLVDGEAGIGCRNLCKYCQYTYVRRPLGEAKAYNPGVNYSNTTETDWHAIEIVKAGRYTTAWDGWSEPTRRKVAKPIKDEDILDKLLVAGNRDVKGATFIKVFQIVGYPWESPESVLADIEQTKKMLCNIKREIKNRIVLAFMITPFGPEPFTPMQYDRADINTSWKDILGGMSLINEEKFTAYMLPVISGAHTLMKRVMINRGEIEDLELFKKISFTSRLIRIRDEERVKWLLNNNIVDESMFSKVERAAFDYLIPPIPC